MRFSQIVLGASVLLLGLAAAELTEHRIIRNHPDLLTAVEHAKAAGIDPYGPIPDDYTTEVNGTYHIQPGTKAAKWVLAQIAKPPVGGPVEKRQQSSFLGVAVWDQGCNVGPVYWVQDVLYNQAYASMMNMNYLAFAQRFEAYNENLSFRRSNGVDLCANWSWDIIGIRAGPADCFWIPTANCYTLLN